jgi:hypothetical protein
MAWEAVQAGATWGRDPFVLALDGFEPRVTLNGNLLFFPLMQVAYENSRVGRRLASHVVSFRRVLSPLAVVPTPQQMEWAIEQGRREFEPHLPLVRKVMEPLSPSAELLALGLTTTGTDGSSPSPGPVDAGPASGDPR